MPPTRQRSEAAKPFSELLAELRAMQPAALRLVFDWLAPSVSGYLRVRGADDPDGLTNDAFLRVFRKIRSFEGDQANFRSWVFTIAHNLLIDERRKQQRQVATVELDDAFDRPAADAEAAVLERLGLDEAAEMLAPLTDDQRTVVYLRIVAGLSVAETATVMRREINAVKALQHRALGALRRHVDAPSSQISWSHP